MSLAPKDPDVPETYSIDWTREIRPDVLRSAEYALGALVYAPRDTGFYYECTRAGRTAQHNPIFPRTKDVVFVDGSCEWTSRHPDDVSAVGISSAVWTVPTGITKDSQQESGAFTHITLSGGTDGIDYELTCRMTPTSGNVVERTIVIPVRSA